MNRANLKQTAKDNLAGNFGTAIIAMIIVAIATGVPSAISTNLTQSGSSGGSFFISIISLFILPIQIGLLRVHMNITEDGSSKLESILSGFMDGRYLKNVLTLFLMGLFTFLWTLLLIIPGIIKGLAYSMTPYILADPDFEHLSATEAIGKSSDMMDGYKMEYFILGLSFILWIFLVIITCGIAVFYVGPYMQQTMTEFYYEVKGTPSFSPLDTDTLSSELDRY